MSKECRCGENLVFTVRGALTKPIPLFPIMSRAAARGLITATPKDTTP